MGIRLLDTGHLVALGFGAGEALVSAKVTGTGPGGIPWPVLYEGAGVAAGLFGSKVGIPAEVRDSVLLGSLALAGARLTRIALAGKLMAGPKAWGGDHVGGDAYAFADPGTGGAAALPAGRSNVRALNARSYGGGFSVSGYNVPVFEAPGVAG